MDYKNKENTFRKLFVRGSISREPSLTPYHRECRLRTDDAAGLPNGAIFVDVKSTLTLTIKQAPMLCSAAD